MQHLHLYTDYNECLVNNGNCSHNCTNLIPGHQCSCLDGFILDRDNRTWKGKKSDTNILWILVLSLLQLTLLKVI